MQSETTPERRGGPKPGDVLAGKYRIEGLVGEGGMGSVYAARNLATGKRVALKWVLAERSSDVEVLQRFQREARAAGRIDHPNVVSVYDVGQHGPSTFLVMELLHGQPISKLMKQGPLPVNIAIDLLMPALRGIAAAHAQGVIHRDLKPDNIFLCMAPDGTPRETKVLDFGISKMTDEVREGLSVTRTGTIVGTPYYMSPEQVRGMRDLDVRLDVYAMGVILYQMLARRPPFVAESYSALVVEIATGSPPNLLSLRPDVDAKLAEVIDKAMAREREHRYQDIRSFALALEPFGTRRFDERPDWTDEFLLPKGLPSLAPGLAATDPDVVEHDEHRISQQQTMASQDVVVDVEEPATVASARLEVEVPDSDPPSLAQPAPLAGRGTLIAGIVIGVGLAIVALVLLSSGESEPTPAAVAPPPASAVAPDERAENEPTSAEEEQRTDQVLPESEAEVAPAGAAEPAEAEATATPATAAEAERAARTPPARRRAARRARTTRPVAMQAESEMTATEPQPAARGMNRPRAGALSLDDF